MRKNTFFKEKKLLNKISGRKVAKRLNYYYILFLLFFILGIIINLPSLIPSYSMDGYCTLCTSFKTYALFFVQAGRFLTALSYLIIYYLNISPNIVSTFSIILSCIFLSISAILIYKQISKFFNNDIYSKILILICSFVICYNPLMIECLIFEESFALTLAFLIAILSANKVYSSDKFSVLKSISLLLLSSFLYQGMLCIYIPYLFLLSILNKKNYDIVKNIKDNLKLYIKGFFSYASALVFSFVLLKIILKVFNLTSQKFGELNILTNIKSIIGMVIGTYNKYYNYIDAKYYNFFILLLIILAFGLCFKNCKKEYSKIIYVFVLIILCFGCTYVPNLAMNSLENYSAARMSASIEATFGLVMLMIAKFVNDDNSIKKYFMIVLIIISTIFAIYNCTLYYKNSYYGLIRYNNDKEYSLTVKNKINEYEKASDNNIDTIYFYISPDIPYYYYGLANGSNIRFYAVDWGFSCGLSYFIANNINIYKLSEEQQNKLDLSKYKRDDNLMYMFEKNKLYLITTK